MEVSSYLLGKKSGSGGTTDYSALTNKPSINNVELSGNKSSSDLGVQEALVSGTNIKTINNTSLLGSGDITVGSASIPAHLIDLNNYTNYFETATAEAGVYIPKNGPGTLYWHSPRNNSSSSIDIAENFTIFKKYDDCAEGEVFMELYTYWRDSSHYKAVYVKDTTQYAGYRREVYQDTTGMPVNTSTLNTFKNKNTFYLLPEVESYTAPTDDKQFTPKKYVDDLPTTYTGYDATKTQILKNVNGTLTWVDE